MKKTICIWILLTAICLGARAQEVLLPVENTVDDVEQVEERVSKLEKALSKLPTISGAVNLRYQYKGSDDSHGFDVRRVRFGLKGDIGRKVEYRFQVEFANTPKILDASVTWKICDYIGMQVGQFKIPFSLENPYGPGNLEMMDNSLVISNLVCYSDVAGVASNGRDIGLAFSGNFFRRDGFSIINYSLGVFNGAGINRLDNNKPKDFIGMLTINPIKNLSLAGYHYNGWGYESGDVYDPVLDVYEEYETNFRRIRSGGGAKYDDGKWLARAEYIWGKTADFHSEGAYGTLGYMVHETVQLAAKYDYWKRDMANKDTMQQYYTFGISYLPVKYCRLQLNYSYRTFKSADNYHYVAAQVIGMF